MLAAATTIEMVAKQVVKNSMPLLVVDPVRRLRRLHDCYFFSPYYQMLVPNRHALL